MFNQGHQGGHNFLMNGGPNHPRYNVHMGLGKQFQQHNQQHQNHQSHHPQPDHGPHNVHAANFQNHQHSLSGGLTPQYQHNHGQNGTPHNAHSALANAPNEHWKWQLQAYQAALEARTPHHHARNTAHAKHAVLATVTNGSKKEAEKDEAQRPTAREVIRQEWLSIDFGAQGLKAISPAIFEYTFLDKVYFNFNKISQIPPRIGQLRNLTYLDLSCNQITEIPPEIGMLSNLRELLLFDNPISTLPYEMGLLYSLEILGIEGCPLDEGLKSLIVERGTAELIGYLREHCPGPDPPAERDWIVVDETPETGDDQYKFSVLSYNILCDTFANSSHYGYTAQQALTWEHRKETILDELRARKADIICLQECNAEAYNEDFRPALAHLDYKGLYWPRSRSRTMNEKEARLVDGCATFYKSSRYVLLDKQLIDYANLAINRPDMKGEHDIFNRVMPRDHIGTVTFLEERATGIRVIVVNTHLFWDPAYVDVKLVQGAILMEQLTKLAEKYAKWPACTDKEVYRFANGDKDGEEEAQEPIIRAAPSVEYSSGNQIPLILCGDYNSTPGSPIYQLFTRGALPSSHPDFANRSYGSFTRDGMTHPFTVKSSYSSIGELSFTNYTPNYVAPIDYIFYSPTALQVTALLGEVDKAYLQRVPGFPNHHFPSDHLALLAEFFVKGKKNG
ncbi:glucose-repressible alcohol dehydrogenase transcriptional effector [Viridothelium virens]|uniref:CCR4-Not complex 3'-5'-exoribonuclease subunit Ccr4 n=1 Tax=Viridothelium virens TaxID=1048519 RepID=A0A6A6H6H6_VIRVR|nr:glucose-repressible alcohol dehydrogenase transcriptional effector [Viridothelium virens]